MFKLENTTKLKSTLLGVGISAVLATSLSAMSQKQEMSVDGAVKYNDVAGKYGPYYAPEHDNASFDNYRLATPKEVKVWNVDVRPDGLDLPEYDMKHGEPVMEDGKPKKAEGSAEWGEELYNAQCVMCHGEFGAGGKGYPTLVGGKVEDLVIQRLNPADEEPNHNVALKTIGSYWPYASTLWWYIQDAMPFTHPKSLTNSETYAITAYLLAENGIEIDGEPMDFEFVLNKDNFNKIVMPNVDGFYPEVDTEDPHQGPKNMQALLSDPTIYGKGTRCMSKCFEEEHGAGKTVDDLLMKINIDLAPTINEPVSTKRSWKEPEVVTASSVDPEIVQNYETYCSACHANKAIGAPVVGDSKAWAEVMEKGIDEVYDNAINGINAMPPMGTAVNMPIEDFKAIIDYMIDESK